MSARVQPQWLPTELGLGRFNPAATRVLPQGALLGGYLRGPENTLSQRVAAIYLLGSTQSQRTYEEAGWIVALEVGWAVLAREGPTFHLLSSADGSLWTEVGPIPAASVTRLVAAGPQELWAMGAGTLVRSTDAGKSWQAVTPPRPVDSTRDQLVVQPGTLLLAGQDLAATTDGGQSWRSFPTEGEVGAVDRSLVALRSGARVQLAAMEPTGLAPLVEFQKEMRPFRLCAEGDTWQFLAVPLGAEIGKGVFHYLSTDAGRTWEASLIDCRAEEGAADVSAAGRGVAVDSTGRVLTFDAGK